MTADLATWSVSFSDEGTTLAPVQASVDNKSRAVRQFFQRAGFTPDEISDTATGASSSYDRDRKEDRVSVSRSIQLRSRDAMKVRAAYARQSELIRDGVPLSGSNVNYVFTGLNALKPQMIAEANRNARRSAEQFAHDSGAEVGQIKTPARLFLGRCTDGDACEECASSGSGSPFQKVRVVTTIDYDIG